MSRITCLLFVPTSTFHYSISITLCYASAIVYTSVACCTLNCTSMDSCSSFTITLSSLASVCTISASTSCCSLTSSYSDSSMHTIFTNVAPSPVLLSCMPMSSTFVPKLNSRCSNCIYVLNYHLCKVYLLIICIPFYTR